MSSVLVYDVYVYREGGATQTARLAGWQTEDRQGDLFTPTHSRLRLLRAEMCGYMHAPPAVSAEADLTRNAYLEVRPRSGLVSAVMTMDARDLTVPPPHAFRTHS